MLLSLTLLMVLPQNSSGRMALKEMIDSFRMTVGGITLYDYVSIATKLGPEYPLQTAIMQKSHY